MPESYRFAALITLLGGKGWLKNINGYRFVQERDHQTLYIEECPKGMPLAIEWFIPKGCLRHCTGLVAMECVWQKPETRKDKDTESWVLKK